MSPRFANLILLLAGASWGMGFVAQETAMEDMGPMLFIGLRFLLAAIVALPFAIYEQQKSTGTFTLAAMARLAPVGLIFFAGMTLQQIGLMGTTVTNAGFLTALYVVIVPFILLIFLREQQAFIVWPAALMSIVGIGLLSGGEFTSLSWGDWLVMLCAVFWALHVILVGKIGLASGTPVTMATLQFLICGVLGIAGYLMAPVIGLVEPVANWAVIYGALPEILYAGIIAGAFAFVLQALGQQYTSAATAAILLSSESLFAALFGALLLGERLAAVSYLGCAMIFIALALVELKPSFLKRNNTTVFNKV